MAKKLDMVESELPKITGIDFKSPVKFELEIQRQRILYILHTAIKKMKLMAFLPLLLKDNCKILKVYLQPAEVDFVLFACSKYMPGGQRYSLKTKPSLSKFTRVIDNINLNQYDQDNEEIVTSLLGSVGNDHKVDHHISQVVQIITSNTELVKYIETMPYEVDRPLYILIDCMNHLKELTREKLMINSQEQLENDRQLRVAFKTNVVITQNIKQVKEQIEKQKKELGLELDKKNDLLREYKDKLEKLQGEFQIEMERLVQESEKKMMLDAFASDSRQIDLEKKANEAANQYATLLESDLIEENLLRAKRNKVEAQLASWLTKYDNDVGEKQNELEKLQEQHTNMKDEYADLMHQFEEQTKIYNVLMAEKYEEEGRIFSEKLIRFRDNRSARRIQRAWRAYWQRKLERRRSRRAKGKDKKKKPDPKEKPEKKMPKVDKKLGATAALQKAFRKSGHVFEEVDTTKEFSSTPVEVNLEE